MKLSDIKKKADAKKAEDEAARKQAQLMKELDVHPLLKWGCARDVREAYFCGIVFAALADDVTIDAGERKAIDRVGRSLALATEEIEEVVTGVSKVVKEAIDAGGDTVFALLEEVAAELKNAVAFKIFVAEFVKVCATKRFERDDVKSMLAEHVAVQSEHKMEDVPYDTLCRVAICDKQFNRDDLLQVADWMGQDSCRYLMLDVLGDDVKTILDAHQTMSVNRSALPAKLVAIIEGDDTWPVEFKPSDYQALLDVSGIPGKETGRFVAKTLLQPMKRVCELAKARIKEVEIIHDPDDDDYHGARFESVREFRILFRYAFFLDAFVDLNDIYEKFYFFGAGVRDCDYYLPSLTLHEGHFSYKHIGSERFERVSKILLGGHITCPDMVFDRLRCEWGIYDEESNLYFKQWDELFSAIEKRFASII